MKKNNSVSTCRPRRSLPQLTLSLVVCGTVWMIADCGGGSAHIVRGDQLATIGLQEEALAEYQLAAKEKPTDSVAVQRIGQIKKSMAQNANERGQVAMEARDYLRAATAFSKATALDAGLDTYQKNLKKAVDAALADAQQLVYKGEFEAGVSKIKALRNEVPHDPTARQALNDAETAWAGKLFESAKGYEGRGLYGNALIALVKLRAMHAAFQDSEAHEKTCREILVASAKYTVRAVPSQHGAGQKKVGAEQVVASLRGQTSQKCAIFAWTEGDNSTLNLDIGLEGVTFSEHRTNSPAQQKYQSGIRKVDNPRYHEIKTAIATGEKRVAELSVLLKKDERDVDTMRQVFADAGPDDDDAGIRSKLAASQQQLTDHRVEVLREKDQELTLRNELTRTPRTLDEPVFHTHTYQVATVTRTATVKVKVVATRGGKEEVVKETIPGSMSTTDTTTPANAKYSIAADPLRFPKIDTELAQEAIAAAAATIFQKIEDHCGRFQEELLLKARKAAKNALPEATENYVQYLFLTHDPSTPEVAEFFLTYHQLDDAAVLLRTTGL